jgi:DNA modification methylase
MSLYSNITAADSICQTISLKNLIVSNESKNLYEYDSKKDLIKSLSQSISEIGQDPIIVAKLPDNKFVIINGVLRFYASKSLNLKTINAIVYDKEFTEDFTLMDYIIHTNIQKEKSNQEKKNEIIGLLRINNHQENPPRDKEKRISIISNMNGRGWKRSNVLNFEKILIWEKQNPNSLDLSDKVISGELSFNKALFCISTLESDDYDFNKEVESKILEGHINGKYNSDKVRNLITSYNTKKDNGFTTIDLAKYCTKNYQITQGDSLKIEFPKGTQLDGIVTSIPYFNQIHYGDNPSEMGWEKSPQEFVDNVADVIMKGAEVTKDTGVFAINLNESYFKGICLGIVPLLIAELKRRGLLYIENIIWEKDDNKPNPDKVSRFQPAYEYILIFAKTTNYYFDKIKIKDQSKRLKVTAGCSEQGSDKKSFHIANNYTQLSNFMGAITKENIVKINIRNERSQDVGSESEFFGSFPSLLPVPIILTYTPIGGTIWDPYAGTGTTGRCALMLGRKTIMSELYEKNISKIIEMLEKGESEYNKESLMILNQELGLISDENYSPIAA